MAKGNRRQHAKANKRRLSPAKRGTKERLSQPPAKEKPLGVGGLQILAADESQIHADCKLVERAARQKWEPTKEAATFVPDKMQEIVGNEEANPIARVAAASAMIQMLNANVDVDFREQEIEIRREEVKIKRRRLHLDKLKARQNGVSIHVTNQVANVAPSLTNEQRQQRLDEIRSEIRKSIPGEGGSETDREPGAEAPAAQDVAPAADDPGGDAAGPLAGRCAPLQLE